MGLFDGAISQMEGLFETNVKPMFSQLVGELQAIRGTDAHLDASVAALDQHLSALDQHIRALNQHMKALNAHPAVAAKAPAR